MTDFPSLPRDSGADRIVYVRTVRTADLPEPIQAQTKGLDHLYAIHAADGACLALLPDRKLAFSVARRNEFAPVSAH